MQTNQLNDKPSGSILEGVAAPYDFQIMDVINEAWQRTSGLKGAVIGAGALILMILAVASFAVVFILDLFPFINQGLMSIVVIILESLVTILSYPFLAGIMMMGLHRSVDAPVSYKMAFLYFSYTLPIIIASICMSVLIALGFFLLLVPGLYLSIAYMFALPLIVEKNMDFWQAMEVSRKAVTQHWFKLFFTCVIMSIIYLISAIPLGLGLIWTIPMFIAMHGILYRRIFGIESI